MRGMMYPNCFGSDGFLRKHRIAMDSANCVLRYQAFHSEFRVHFSENAGNMVRKPLEVKDRSHVDLTR
ncbi:uncharacterized protein PHALS_15276 [Plasmopara halstedii]|uniref:Uncharacterized protein n=1 Tax=Plasmopara halstedii TaxID=4781 RepID=A0A0P1ASH7_PLAHL|nr:uncharacterized protein PHALS_15276 [Plasmopara halstedii]CEG44505.1 hypothetical protein PHALS_15276 [Plasmopara halstedii]|eukprot:XP_024580874.1 hypothetical protein PHALS_15276 [Plasmopara halstedii]